MPTQLNFPFFFPATHIFFQNITGTNAFIGLILESFIHFRIFISIKKRERKKQTKNNNAL